MNNKKKKNLSQEKSKDQEELSSGSDTVQVSDTEQVSNTEQTSDTEQISDTEQVFTKRSHTRKDSDQNCICDVIEESLFEELNASKYWSLMIDESSTISDDKHLAIV
ncbi:18102_t:CDS:2, partial [Racocetra fulgida]